MKCGRSLKRTAVFGFITGKKGKFSQNTFKKLRTFFRKLLLTDLSCIGIILIVKRKKGGDAVGSETDISDGRR